MTHSPMSQNRVRDALEDINEALGVILHVTDIPKHKLEDAQFLRGVVFCAKDYAKAASEKATALTAPSASDASGAEGVINLQMPSAQPSGIYMASKTSHAARWRQLRADGVPIISTWIDEAGKGETACFADLWSRCIDEAATARAVIVYMEPGEVLKGAFVEVGAALSCGVPVYAVGCDEFSFTNHIGVTRCASLNEALSLAAAPTAPAQAPSRPVDADRVDELAWFPDVVRELAEAEAALESTPTEAQLDRVSGAVLKFCEASRGFARTATSPCNGNPSTTGSGAFPAGGTAAMRNSAAVMNRLQSAPKMNNPYAEDTPAQAPSRPVDAGGVEAERDEVLFAFHRYAKDLDPPEVTWWTRHFPQFAADIREHAVELIDMRFRAALVTQPTGTEASRPVGGEAPPCHWGGGNDIIWCSVCGEEYAYAKGEQRPPCPRTVISTPSAFSDSATSMAILPDREKLNRMARGGASSPTPTQADSTGQGDGR